MIDFKHLSDIQKRIRKCEKEWGSLTMVEEDRKYLFNLVLSLLASKKHVKKP